MNLFASLRTALSRGLRIGVHCSEGCTLSYSLVLDAATARRYHARRTVAGATAVLHGAATKARTLRLSLPRKARSALRLVLTLRVRARDAAGNTVTRSATITLRR